MCFRFFSRFGKKGTHIFPNATAVKMKESQFDETRSNADLLAIHHAQALYLRTLSKEEAFWKQKARVKWLEDGDRNTNFYHASFSSKRAKLSIHRIKDGAGVWIEDLDLIRQNAAAFFQNLLAPPVTPADLPAILGTSDNDTLSAPVDMSEFQKLLPETKSSEI